MGYKALQAPYCVSGIVGGFVVSKALVGASRGFLAISVVLIYQGAVPLLSSTKKEGEQSSPFRCPKEVLKEESFNNSMG